MSDMSKDDAPTIRIVRKKVVGGGHHGGAWKVAYADFVTAMMAFFLVMWIVGLNKPIREAIASYFRNPSGFVKTSQGGTSPMSLNEAHEKTHGKNAPFIPQDGGKPDEGSTVRMQFKEAAKAIEQQLNSNPEFRDLRDSVKITLTAEGLRIELIEKTSSLFFDTGSAVLKARSLHLLSVIAKELGRLKNNPVVIEGHTDSRPLNGANGYSNWELSTDRANAARRAMEGRGLHSNQVIAVRGYADRRLLRKDEPTHFSNRRVSILVPYSTKSVNDQSEVVNSTIAGGAGIKPDLAAEAKASGTTSEGGSNAGGEQPPTESGASKEATQAP